MLLKTSCRPWHGKQKHLFSTRMIRSNEQNMNLQLSLQAAGYTMNKSLGEQGVLGEGGFGRVVAACSHDQPAITYAVKTINIAKAAQKRSVYCKDELIGTTIQKVVKQFEAEVGLLRYLQYNSYPHAPLVTEACVIKHHFVMIVMELCQESMEDVIKRQKRVRLDEGCDILLQVSSALHTLHTKHGILHCDVKPGNIMRRYSQRQHLDVVLVDFGNALKLDRNNQSEHLRDLPTNDKIRTGGSHRFQDPYVESLQSKPSCTSDFVSALLTWLTLVCGRLPYEQHYINGNRTIAQKEKHKILKSIKERKTIDGVDSVEYLTRGHQFLQHRRGELILPFATSPTCHRSIRKMFQNPCNGKVQHYIPRMKNGHPKKTKGHNVNDVPSMCTLF